MALPVVSLAMNVFRCADADAAIVYWFRKGGYSWFFSFFFQVGGSKAYMLMQVHNSDN
jgi:hypothetical protein